MFRFEKLAVWHRAVDYAEEVYMRTRSFPDDEKFGLTSQMRRAAVSVSSNIAEGSGRGSDKDFARFVELGYSSLMETVSQSHVVLRQRFLQQQDMAHMRCTAVELARMLSGLKSSLLRN